MPFNNVFSTKEEKKEKKKRIFNTLHAIKVLYDNPQEKLTLEEISKEVVKETTFPATFVATELKSRLDTLVRLKYIKEFDLDDKTETKYQITTDGVSWNYTWADPRGIKARRKKKKRESKEFQRKLYLEKKARISEEKKIYKKDKDHWKPMVSNGVLTGYVPRTRAERKRSRRELLFLFICLVALFTIFVVAIFLGPILF